MSEEGFSIYRITKERKKFTLKVDYGYKKEMRIHKPVAKIDARTLVLQTEFSDGELLSINDLIKSGDLVEVQINLDLYKNEIADRGILFLGSCCFAWNRSRKECEDAVEELCKPYDKRFIWVISKELICGDVFDEKIMEVRKSCEESIARLNKHKQIWEEGIKTV